MNSRNSLSRAVRVTVVMAGVLTSTAAAFAESGADTAVQAAKKICSGKTLTIVWEAGLQSLDPVKLSGPQWEQLTGCKLKVVEVPISELFTKIMQE